LNQDRPGDDRGSGAPLNNPNALKNGEFSGQLRQTLYEGSPHDWHEFLSRLKDDRFRARVNMSATLLWIRVQSFDKVKIRYYYPECRDFVFFQERKTLFGGIDRTCGFLRFKEN
jgi:hypothetical protein